MFDKLNVELRRQIVYVYKASRTFVTVFECGSNLELLLNIVISLCHLLLNCISTWHKTDMVASQCHNEVDGQGKHEGTCQYHSWSGQLRVPSSMYLWHSGTYYSHSHSYSSLRKSLSHTQDGVGSSRMTTMKVCLESSETKRVPEECYG